MKTLLSNTKFYDFSRKFWQVTAYLELFGGHGGQELHWGPRPLLVPLEPPLSVFIGPGLYTALTLITSGRHR